MTNEEGVTMKRFIINPGIQTSGTYNAAYASARSHALVEIQAMIKTELVASIEQKTGNMQESSLKAETIDTFKQEVDAIVEGTLTNAMPVLSIYRRHPNGTFEVQVSIAVDKKEVLNRMRDDLKRRYKHDGAELYRVTEKVMGNK